VAFQHKPPSHSSSGQHNHSFTLLTGAELYSGGALDGYFLASPPICRLHRDLKMRIHKKTVFRNLEFRSRKD